jgi:ABC-type bacteriocin/lantibiotic exporter with double-glycine peptidase domain
MLLVPCFRQPDPVACLPACVWSVLTYQGYQVSFDAIREMCSLDRKGANIEVAMLGLSRADWDLRVVEPIEPATLMEALDEDQPVIVTLSTEEMLFEEAAHAVVVCGLDGESVTVMDPAAGDYREMPVTEFVEAVVRAAQPGFWVGGAVVR